MKLRILASYEYNETLLHCSTEEILSRVLLGLNIKTFTTVLKVAINFGPVSLSTQCAGGGGCFLHFSGQSDGGEW